MGRHELIEKNLAEAQRRLDLYERRQPWHEPAFDQRQVKGQGL